LTTFVSSIKAATKDFEAFVSKYYMKINLKYNFPYGMGLGSSASFNVALAAAVYTVARKLEGESYKDMSDLDFKFDQKWMIRNIANEGETAAHKTVSGTETTIVSLGGIYRYCKFDNIILQRGQ
jgi:mevalonate kinase